MSATFEGSGHRQHFTLNAIVQLYDIKFSYVRYFPTTKHTAFLAICLVVGSGLLKKRKEKKREKRGKEEERKGGKREKGE